MEEFVKQFGIDWRLLASQMVNFLIVLVILRFVVYKPIAAILHERRRKVEEGIAKSEEADRRLQDAQDMTRRRIKEAEEKAAAFLRGMEAKAKEREAVLLESSRRKGEVMLQEAGRVAEAERAKVRAELDKEARRLVREALVRVVEMDPGKIDEALLEKALGAAAKHS